MTPQQILDTAYLGLKAQGKKSKNDTACAYRGPNGTKCGVGMLIDDETARCWDGEPNPAIRSIISAGADGVEPWMVENLGLLRNIQYAHDKIDEERWHEHFEVHFNALYKKYNLVKPEVV